MKNSIAIAITALGIGFCANVFANASGTQVNPSTINLSAAGVTDVGIHTQLAAGTPVACVEVVDSANQVFVIDSLTIGADSLGHLVITIPEDAWAAVATSISLGEAGFYVFSVCGNGADSIADDTARIVNNSGRQ